MNTTEATALLEAELQPFRALSHAQLCPLLRAPVATQVVAPSGGRYQVLVQAAWVDRPGGALRVVGGIDDSGWQRFTPLVASFVMDAPRDGAPAGPPG